MFFIISFASLANANILTKEINNEEYEERIGDSILPYWYSGSLQVNFWSNMPSKVYVYSFSGMPDVFRTAMRDSVSAWSSALGYNITYEYSPNDSLPTSGIKFFGGDSEQLDTLGVFEHDDLLYGNMCGQVISVRNLYTTQFVTPTGDNVSVYKNSIAYGAILNLSSESVSPTFNNYLNICLHEMGHALGWYGHSSSSSDVMYKAIRSNNTSLTNRDINHIRQIYNRLS